MTKRTYLTLLLIILLYAIAYAAILTSQIDTGCLILYSLPKNLCRNSSGNLHVVYTKSDGTKYQILYGKSTDSGANWTVSSLTSASYDQYYPTIACDSSDNLHVAWYGKTSTRTTKNQIRYMKYSSGAWSGITEITDENYNNYCPQIAVDGSDVIHLVWHGGAGGEIRHNYYTSGAWQGITNITNETSAQTYPLLAIDSTNVVHVVWAGIDAGLGSSRIRYASWNGAWSGDTNLTDGNYASLLPSIAIDSNNYLHVVCYCKSATSTVLYQIGYILYNGSWQAETDLTSDATYSQYSPSIAVDSNDYLHVVWYGRHSGSTTFSQIRYLLNNGSWQAIVNLTSDDAEDNNYANLMWAMHPTISGTKPSRPHDGYCFIWMDNDDPWYYASTDISWDTTVTTTTTISAARRMFMVQ